MPFEEAPIGVTGLETAFAALYTDLVEPGVLAARDCCVERMSAGPARALRPAGAARSRSARRRTSCLLDLEAEWDGRRGRLQSRSANSLASLGQTLTRRASLHDGRRRRGRLPRARFALSAGMSAATSLLEDGTRLRRRRSVGARGRRRRRGRLHDRR